MNDNIPRHFISCDWGTSRFRLRLVKTRTLEVISEITTDRGAARLARTGTQENEEERFQRFARYLYSQAKTLTIGRSEQSFTCVISGMASSSIGMRELPYSDLPFGASGKELLCERFDAGPSLNALLISGVSGKENVMRGEEVQAIGLSRQLDFEQPGTLLLPGTHSKHIKFNQSRFLEFETFMTGELFEILSSNTTLAGSVQSGTLDKRREQAFLEGVQRGAEHGLSSQLFAVRAGQLLQLRDPLSSSHFLSGLLLGSELAHLVNTTAPVWLAAPQSLSLQYQLTMRTLLPKAQLRFIPTDQVERALLAGQRKMLALQAE